MAENRKLIKTNLRGFRSETTERNERLKIWLGFISTTLGTFLAAISLN